MSWISDLISAGLSAAKVVVPDATKIAIGSTTVTAAQLETATGSLGTFFSAMATAIKAKNAEDGIELTIEEGVTIAADLGLGEPFTGIAKAVLPFIFQEGNQILAEPLIAVDGGRLGYVTKDWADDKRHQLNSDGSFKD